MEKGVYLLALLLFWSCFLQAQLNPIDVFRSNPQVEIERYGEDVMTHLIRGDNQMILGNFNEALLSYDNAITQSPYWAEAYLKRAIAKERIGMSREAREDYQLALRLNPYVADLYGYPSQQRRRALLTFPVERYLLTADKETETAFARAGAPDPARQAAQLDRAANLIQGNSIPEAIQIYDELIQYPNSLTWELYRSRSIARFLNGDLEGARRDAERWYEASGESPEFYFLLMGNIHFLYGDFDNAIDYFSQVIRLNGDHETAYYNRGLALLLFYNRADACHDLERSAELGLELGAIKQQYFCNY